MIFNLLAFFWNILRHLAWVFDKESPLSKFELVKTYFSLLLQYAFESLHLKSSRNISMLKLGLTYADLYTTVHLFEEIFLQNIYFFKSKNKSPKIIDCGSHIGMSVFYFKKIYPGAKIVCFEPDKSAFEILKQNVEQNEFENVTLINKAVFSKAGPVKMYMKNDKPASGTGGVYPLAEYTSEKLEAVVLSKYLKEKIDFLKMDIEGAELPVFEELSRKNKLKFVQKLVLEYHHHQDPQKDELSKLLAILEKNNFGYSINAYHRSNTYEKELQGIIIYAYQK